MSRKFRIIKEELYRAFVNRWMVFAIIIGCIISIMQIVMSQSLIKGIENVYSNGGDNIYAAKVAYTFTIWDGWIGTNICSLQRLLFFIMPLVSAMIYAGSYVSDMKGYINNICTRVGKQDYILAKNIAVFVSGGLVAVIPLILNMLLWMMLLPTSMPNPIDGALSINDLVVFSALFYEAPYIYCIIYIIYVFIFYGLLSCMGIVISMWDSNSFVVRVFPFIAFYALHTVTSYLGFSKCSPIQLIIMPIMIKKYAYVMAIIMLIMAVMIALTIVMHKKRDMLK